jgi:hypothetical protein
MMKTYLIRRAARRPGLDGRWDSEVWAAAETARIEWFHPAGSEHRPVTLARVLYDDEALYVHFRVENDRFIRCVHTEFQSAVFKDSCVEFFFQPGDDKGYFNFEMNCGGALLARYYPDPHPDRAVRHERSQRLTPEDAAAMRIYHSLPSRVEPELPGPVTWGVEYSIPLAVLERHAGPLRPLAGRVWHGNFYKCGDEVSHPHWGAWNPVGEELNFHQPSRFGVLIFAPA